MIGSGRLRFPASVLQPSATTDDLGQRNGTFNDLTAAANGNPPLWVDLRTDSAAEQQYADGVATVRRAEIRCRWNSLQKWGINETFRLVVRGRTFRIAGITNLDERDMVAVIEAEEVV